MCYIIRLGDPAQTSKDWRPRAFTVGGGTQDENDLLQPYHWSALPPGILHQCSDQPDHQAEPCPLPWTCTDHHEHLRQRRRAAAARTSLPSTPLPGCPTIPRYQELEALGSTSLQSAGHRTRKAKAGEPWKLSPQAWTPYTPVLTCSI